MTVTREEIIKLIAGGFRDTTRLAASDADIWVDILRLNGEAIVDAMDEFSVVASPPVLGSLPPGSPPDDPISRAVIKMFGGRPRESTTPDVFYGMPGSPGVARGRVRIVRSLAEGEALQHGEVLVSPTTAPPWTPLFARAAAIVTDAGGILSHCAVVAREYSIPAVVGSKRATSVLRDGQLIEVDGTSGSIRIVEA